MYIIYLLFLSKRMNLICIDMKIKDLENRKRFSECIRILCASMFFIALAFTHAGCSSDKNEDEPEIYTVTFETDGGTPKPASQQIEAGGIATAPSPNPTKEGYAFVFWHLNEATTAYNFQTPVSRDITLYAEWQKEAVAEYWQVTWELNGGAWPSGDNHATQVVKGGTLAEPAAPTKAGNTFAGWYTESALTNKITFPYSVSNVTNHFTLYAKWEDATKAEYSGTWRDSRYEDWDQFDISNDKVECRYRSGNTITFEGLTWKEATHTGEFAADYSKGFTLSGTVTKINGIELIKEDKSGIAKVGDRVAINAYMGADKKNILVGIVSEKDVEVTFGPYFINNAGYWQITWELNGGTWPSGDNHDVQVPKDGKF